MVTKTAGLKCSVLLTVIGLGAVVPVCAEEVTLFDGQDVVPVIYSDAKGAKTADARTMALAAQMLGRDLKALTGKAPVISQSLKDCAQTCIVIGGYDSPLIQQLARSGGLDASVLTGQWERYGRAQVLSGGRSYLLIYGSDIRGTIYGVTDLSRELGVSPWEWWADVTPRKVGRLTVAADAMLSKSPSVKYRGIFLNDEDWGLEPWAEKTFEPEVGNIGPKTYAKVYELMWRLKANTIWPAMHTISTPFYGLKANPKVADDYAIVVGTSHAEPMMRNNLREWDEQTQGPFNFTVNRTKILNYWQGRARESKPYENIYTMGLRGIHDGPMQGAATLEDRKNILEDVIGLQRDILSGVHKRKASDIPQTYVLYHELQEAYDAGLKLPEDITLMWADDNYGYIRRFSNADEVKRSGGSGIYYHLSYWGRPHDYQWLGTTHPYLIHEEMQKAYALQARESWIVNVGDIKPIEYLTQYFLDLAFDADAFTQTPHAHLKAFMSEQFGAESADELTAIMMEFYDLAFERKPEYMGFSETEPVTPVKESDFVKPDGEKAHARLAAYADLTRRAEAIYAQVSEDRKAAYFELVLYPVRAAGNLNGRILNLDLAGLYARQGRASANSYAQKAKTAHQAIVADTATYNGLLDGKWRHMMDMAPRQLPVFKEPVYPQWSASPETGCAIALSGGWWNDENALTFIAGQPQTKVMELFSHQATPVSWRVEGVSPAFRLSQTEGQLGVGNGFEQRLNVTFDGQNRAAPMTVACGDQKITVHTKILPETPKGLITETDRRILIPAIKGSQSAHWETIDGLGSQGASLRAKLDLTGSGTPVGEPVTYRFANFSSVGGKVRVVALPTHALNPALGVRVGLSLDGGPVHILDFATVGRSDQWRANVLVNQAVAVIDLKMLTAGAHELKLYAIDPGVMIDHIEIKLDGADKYYGTIR